MNGWVRLLLIKFFRGRSWGRRARGIRHNRLAERLFAGALRDQRRAERIERCGHDPRTNPSQPE